MSKYTREGFIFGKYRVVAFFADNPNAMWMVTGWFPDEQDYARYGVHMVRDSGEREYTFKTIPLTRAQVDQVVWMNYLRLEPKEIIKAIKEDSTCHAHK